jgi:hypothetical protein
MKITQISVFLENTKGRLYDACSLLSDNNINMRALTIAESPEFGILRLVVDRPEDAVTLLKKNGFAANLTEIVAIEADDRPGGLANILKTLSDNDINVEYMYGFVEKRADKALLVFRFEDPDKAIRVLEQHRIRVIGKQELNNL